MICVLQSFSRTPCRQASGLLFHTCFKQLLEVADKKDDQPQGTVGSSTKTACPYKRKRRLQLGSGGVWRKGRGFEPSTRSPVCRVSGALSHSATFPNTSSEKLWNLEAQPGFEPGCEAFAAPPRRLSATGPWMERASTLGCAQSAIGLLVNTCDCSAIRVTRQRAGKPGVLRPQVHAAAALRARCNRV